MKTFYSENIKKHCGNKEMLSSYYKNRREILRLDVIWLERKGQEETEKTLSHEMMYQFQGAEGSWAWPHCTLHSGNTVRY